jgi:hypothetical protein
MFGPPLPEPLSQIRNLPSASACLTELSTSSSLDNLEFSPRALKLHDPVEAAYSDKGIHDGQTTQCSARHLQRHLQWCEYSISSSSSNRFMHLAALQIESQPVAKPCRGLAPSGQPLTVTRTLLLERVLDHSVAELQQSHCQVNWSVVE